MKFIENVEQQKNEVEGENFWSNQGFKYYWKGWVLFFFILVFLLYFLIEVIL